MALICDNNHNVSCEEEVAVIAEQGETSGVGRHLRGVAGRGAVDTRFVFRGDAAEVLAEEDNVTL
jgi:hypothetical protein